MKKFTKSEKFKSEYSCSIIRIGELIPIKDSDFLAKTLIQGIQIVVRKDQIKSGDLVLYASNETQLSDDFLSANNLYEISYREKNRNFMEVEEILEPYLKTKPRIEELKELIKSSGDEDGTLREELESLKSAGEPYVSEAKKHCGFFGKYGRVRCISLRGEASFGFIFSPQELINYDPSITLEDIESQEGEEFDTINDKLFCKVFIPPIRERKERRQERGNKARKKFNRLIDDTFEYHYDTSQLEKQIYLISPQDQITCSVKLHGTSVIISKGKVKIPVEPSFPKKIINFFCKLLKKPERFETGFYIDYGPIYSSRSVVRNEYINEGVPENDYYDEDIWSKWGKIIYPYLEEDQTVYGEIIGFLENGKAVQDKYDYSCEPRTSKLMIYRIKTDREWEVSEVLEWTKRLISRMKENEDPWAYQIHPIDILYTGTLKNLYPEIKEDEDWHENVLEAMKKDTKTFGMEKREPLCRNKVPREGIVVRKVGDPIKEAFKLKCSNFKKREAGLYDSDQYIDLETVN